MGGDNGRPILVVDDDDDIRWVAEEILTEEGFRVATAPNGAAALDYVARAEPLAILLDMRMPVMDGWAFARAYRAAPGPHAPIIVCTAAREAGERAAEIAASAALPKPFHYDDLVATVRQVIAEAAS